MPPHSFVLEQTLHTLDRLVLEATTKEALAAIGAGHLEAALASEAGADFVHPIVSRARQDPKWKFALGCVWTKNFVDQAVAKHIEACLNLMFPKGRP